MNKTKDNKATIIRPDTATLEHPKLLHKNYIDMQINPVPTMNRGAVGNVSLERPRTVTLSRRSVNGPLKSQTSPNENPAKTKSPNVVTTKNLSANIPTSSTPRKPCFVFCYICSRQFTTASLPIHEPQCLEKWHIENKQLPRDLRRKPPQKPDINESHMTREEIQEAQWKAAQANLVPCNNCQRTFLPDRLIVHQRSCKPKSGKVSQKIIGNEPINSTPEPQKNNTKKITAVRKPPTLICYICGREFGTHSISIHEPQCLKKWHIENQKLPPSAQRPEPIKPAEISISGSKKGYDYQNAMNEAAWEAS